MKRYCVLASTLVVTSAAWGASMADKSLPYAVYPQLVGKPYSRVRLALSAAGNTPVSVRQPPLCPYERPFCDYPELDACAADIPACTLTWKGKNGQFLHVQVNMTSSGSNPQVSSISEDAYE